MVAAISHGASALIIAVVILFGVFAVVLAWMADQEGKVEEQHHRRLLDELKRQPVSDNIWDDA